LIGRRYSQEKKIHGGDRKSSPKNDDLIPKMRTSARLAKELGVGRVTVENSEHFSKAVDKIAAIVPGAKDKILSGEMKASKKGVIALAEGSTESIR